MEKEKGRNVSEMGCDGDPVISSTDENRPFPGIRQEVVGLLAGFAKAYEVRSFNEMRRLLSDDFRGNFAGRKTADGLIAVFRNYRLQTPFFTRVRMTVAIRQILADLDREFAGIVELNTRPTIFGRFFGQPFTTPSLRMTAVQLESGEWRISDLDEFDLDQPTDA